MADLEISCYIRILLYTIAQNVVPLQDILENILHSILLVLSALYFYLTDYDACVFNPCLYGATCTIEEDGFICICSDGYSGDRCETG